jgi:hypothetical protein
MLNFKISVSVALGTTQDRRTGKTQANRNLHYYIMASDFHISTLSICVTAMCYMVVDINHPRSVLSADHQVFTHFERT